MLLKNIFRPPRVPCSFPFRRMSHVLCLCHVVDAYWWEEERGGGGGGEWYMGSEPPASCNFNPTSRLLGLFHLQNISQDCKSFPDFNRVPPPWPTLCHGLPSLLYSQVLASCSLPPPPPPPPPPPNLVGRLY